jgi:hypothetical protein
VTWLACLILAVLFGVTGIFDWRDGTRVTAIINAVVGALFLTAGVLLALGVTL